MRTAHAQISAVWTSSLLRQTSSTSALLALDLRQQSKLPSLADGLQHILTKKKRLLTCSLNQVKGIVGDISILAKCDLVTFSTKLFIYVFTSKFIVLKKFSLF